MFTTKKNIWLYEVKINEHKRVLPSGKEIDLGLPEINSQYCESLNEVMKCFNGKTEEEIRGSIYDDYGCAIARFVELLRQRATEVEQAFFKKK